jgi:hypothetical protein
MTTLRTFRLGAALSAIIATLALPFGASAVTKVFQSLTLSPATMNILALTATNLTSTVTVINGSSGSTSFKGPAVLTFTVVPTNANISASLSSTNLDFPSDPTTQTSTLTVTTTASIASNTYVVSVVCNTNPANASVTPITNTYTITMNTALPGTPLMVWTNATVNSNWSTAANWAPTGPPDSTNDVVFDDTPSAGSAGSVDNIVTGTTTVGSLTYGQTNNYHTTQIHGKHQHTGCQ